MIYLELFLSFFKIGFFSFGGGYAMIPLIQKELEARQWMSAEKFINLIAISEMTPGPIAINSATYIGYETAGILGAVISTIGIALPSFIIITIVSKYLLKYKENKTFQDAFSGIRPVISGLIVTAAFYVAQTSIFKKTISINNILNIILKPIEYINLKGLLILAMVLFVLNKTKINPILVILGSALVGILFFYVI